MDWGIFRPSRATAICFLLLIFSFSLMTLRLTKTVQAFRSFLFYWIAPTQETATTCIQFASDVGSRLSEFVKTHRENVLLKEKFLRLSMLETRYQELLAENQRLKALLDLKNTIGYETIPALVSGRDTQNWTHALWINRGGSDGVEPDSPVIAIQNAQSGEGQIYSAIVGRVLEAGANTSKVLLISDPLSSVAISLVRTGEQGLLTGQGSFLPVIEYLDSGASVELGDEVATSGLGGIFPAGLLIGKVTHISASTLGFKRAEVTPSVPLSKVRDVLVLKKFKKSNPNLSGAHSYGE